jgi:hypothetical protein
MSSDRRGKVEGSAACVEGRLTWNGSRAMVGHAAPISYRPHSQVLWSGTTARADKPLQVGGVIRTDRLLR